MSQTFAKKKIVAKCSRCRFILEKVGAFWFCTNHDCYYHTNAHRCDR